MTPETTTRAALVVAATALALSAVAVFRGPDCDCAERAGAHGTAPASSTAMPAAGPPVAPPVIGAALPVAVSQLDERVRALEKKLVAATRDAGAAVEPVEPPAGGGFPDYVAFTAPSRALTVKQDDDGSLSVRNTDPELALKTVLVEARRADGTVDKIPITIPPAGK